MMGLSSPPGSPELSGKISEKFTICFHCITIGAIMLALELLWFKNWYRSFTKVTVAMWLEKLSQGVLRVLTPLGPRYVSPTFVQRLYLLWIFRNFHTLPVKVLSTGQRRRIDRMCIRHGFVPPRELGGFSETPVLGTLEQRPPLEEQSLPPRRPNQGVPGAPFAADAQQRM
jgi:hypothetical protein